MCPSITLLLPLACSLLMTQYIKSLSQDSYFETSSPLSTNITPTVISASLSQITFSPFKRSRFVCCNVYALFSESWLIYSAQRLRLIRALLNELLNVYRSMKFDSFSQPSPLHICYICLLFFKPIPTKKDVNQNSVILPAVMRISHTDVKNNSHSVRNGKC